MEQIVTKQTEFQEHLNFQPLLSKAPQNILRFIGSRKDTKITYKQL